MKSGIKIAVLAVAALVAMPLMAQQAALKTDASTQPTDKAAAQKEDAKAKKDKDDRASAKKDTANARAAAREAKKGKELEEESHPL